MQTDRARPVRRRGLHRRAVAGGKAVYEGALAGTEAAKALRKGEPHGRNISARPVSGLCVSILGAADPGRTGAAVPLYPPGALRQGARVHSPLESCVGILLLRSGQLRSYLLSEDGRDVTLYRLFGGEVCILSASCVMDAVNIDLYIDAEEDTEALCISAGIFRQLMQETSMCAATPTR